MKRTLGIIVGLALVVGAELWGMNGETSAQVKPPKPPTYVVCSINLTTEAASLTSELITAKPVTVTASAMGPMGAAFYAVFETTTPTTCAALATDMGQSGPFPNGITLEAETTHKPVLK